MEITTDCTHGGSKGVGGTGEMKDLGVGRKREILGGSWT